MTTADFDPLGILEVLNRHGVRYVVLGGFASVAYGSPLLTSDVDVAPDRELDNLARLSDALAELGARIRVQGIDDGVVFAHDATSLHAAAVLNLVTRLGALDLVLIPAGDAAYEELAKRQLVVTLQGVAVPLAALDDVIASKQAAGRPKDRHALPVLHALRDRLLEQAQRTDGPRDDG